MSKSNDSPEEGQRSSPHAAPQNSEPLQRSSSHKEPTDKAGEPWEIPMTPLRPRPQSTVSDTMVLKIDDLLEEEEEDSAEGDEPLSQASLLPPRALPPLDFSETEQIPMSVASIRSRPPRESESTDPNFSLQGNSRSYGTVELDLNDMVEEPVPSHSYSNSSAEFATEVNPLDPIPSQPSTREHIPAKTDPSFVPPQSPHDTAVFPSDALPEEARSATSSRATHESSQQLAKASGDFSESAQPKSVIQPDPTLGQKEHTTPPDEDELLPEQDGIDFNLLSVSLPNVENNPGSEQTALQPLPEVDTSQPFPIPQPPAPSAIAEDKSADTFSSVSPQRVMPEAQLSPPAESFRKETAPFQSITPLAASSQTEPSREERPDFPTALDPNAPTNQTARTPFPTAKEPPSPAPRTPFPTAKEPKGRAVMTPFPTVEEPISYSGSIPFPTTKEPPGRALRTPFPTVEEPEVRTNPTASAAPLLSSSEHGVKPPPASAPQVPASTGAAGQASALQPPPSQPSMSEGAPSLQGGYDVESTLAFEHSEPIQVSNLTDMNFDDLLTNSAEIETFQVDESKASSSSLPKAERSAPALQSGRPSPSTGQASRPPGQHTNLPEKTSSPKAAAWPDVAPQQETPQETLTPRPHEGPHTLIVVSILGLGLLLVIIAMFLI